MRTITPATLLLAFEVCRQREVSEDGEATDRRERDVAPAPAEPAPRPSEPDLTEPP